MNNKYFLFLVVVIALTAVWTSRDSRMPVENEEVVKSSSIKLLFPDTEDYHQYWVSIMTRTFPTEGMQDRLKARAISLVIDSDGSVIVEEGDDVDFTVINGVPAKVWVNGVEVPITPEMYLEEELELIRMKIY